MADGGAFTGGAGIRFLQNDGTSVAEKKQLVICAMIWLCPFGGEGMRISKFAEQFIH
ncbi:MAG: hypothetical protein GJ677_08925 [Rhodobacteraceae bacterium]|nr:hypothetical protein [Paracoccaceae bacterium]